jgi:hypothetical protein
VGPGTGLSVSNTAIDGGGVILDEPLPDGTRIRFRLGDKGCHDVSVYVEDGVLHVSGQYRPLLLALVERNHLEVRLAWGELDG